MENIKTKFKNNIIAWLFGLIVLLGGGYTAGDRLGYFNTDSNCRTGTATTSLLWMTPGTATTTLTCTTGSASNLRVNAILVGSSSQSTHYRYRVERSMNNIDWYTDLNTLTQSATTTAVTGQFADNVIAFSTSTNPIAGTSQDIGFGGRGTTTANFVNFNIPTLGSKYTRVVFYLTIGGRNGAIWAEGVTAEQTR